MKNYLYANPAGPFGDTCGALKGNRTTMRAYKAMSTRANLRSSPPARRFESLVELFAQPYVTKTP